MATVARQPGCLSRQQKLKHYNVLLDKFILLYMEAHIPCRATENMALILIGTTQEGLVVYFERLSKYIHYNLNQ